MEDNFPRNIELVEFFEVEPTILDKDPDLAWAYNELQFRSIIETDELACTISYPAIELTWLREGEEVLFFAIEDAHSIAIQSDPGGRVLVIQSPTSTFRVQLRPRVHIAVHCDSR